MTEYDRHGLLVCYVEAMVDSILFTDYDSPTYHYQKETRHMARRNTETTTATQTTTDPEEIRTEPVYDAATAPTTDPNYTDDPEYSPANADDNDPRNQTINIGLPAQRPRLFWTSAMDEALVSAIRQTQRAPDVVRLLQSHEAFENLPASVITKGKVGGRLSQLRKQGVNVPKLKPGNGGGFQGQRYIPDVEKLNRMLTEPVEVQNVPQ